MATRSMLKVVGLLKENLQRWKVHSGGEIRKLDLMGRACVALPSPFKTNNLTKKNLN